MAKNLSTNDIPISLDTSYNNDKEWYEVFKFNFSNAEVATLSWVRIPVLPPIDLYSISKIYNYYYFLFKRRKK